MNILPDEPVTVTHFFATVRPAMPQVPISENRAINRFCLIRNFATSPAFDFMARE
jgi:hypothetical protein